jgi:predicted MFS family arabinose efflux permease
VADSVQVGTFRSAWQHRRWRYFLSAFAVSSAGDWLYSVALVVFLFERTGSAGWVAAAVVTRMLTYVFLGPVGGALADRHDRRRLLVVFDLVRGALMVGLAVVAWTEAPVLLAVVIATLASASSTPYRAAAVAATPELVAEDDLAAANAAETIVFQVGAFVGPAIGAALVASAGAGWAFFVNALTFTASAALVARLGHIGGGRAEAEEGGDEPGMLREIADGAAVVRRDPGLLALLAFGAAASFLFGFELVAHVLVAEERLGMGASGVGVLAAAAGVGGLLVAPFTARVGGRGAAGTLLVASGVLMGVPMMALALVSSPAVAMAVLLVSGAAVVVQEIIFITVLQRACASDVLARISGLETSAGASGQMLGSLAVPVLVGVVNLEWALVIGGGVMVLASLGAGPALQRLVQRTEAERIRLAPVVEHLRRLGIFGEASQAALERIARSAVPVPMAAGDTVFHEGDEADRLYVVLSGTLAVERAGVGELARLGEDDWFGEIGLLHKAARNATVRCAASGELLAIPGPVFLAALEGPERLPDPLLRAVLVRGAAPAAALDLPEQA